MGAFSIAPMIEMRSYRTNGGLTLLHRVSQYPQLMQSAQKTLDLALSALTKGKLKAAWEHAEQAETIAPSYWRTLYAKGLILAASSRFEAALKPLRVAVRLRPNSVECRIALSVTQVGCGGYRSAIRTLLPLLRSIESPADAWFRLSVALDGAGKPGWSERALLRCLERAPSYAPAWNALGSLYRRQGRLDASVEAFLNGICAAPTSFPNRANLGAPLLESGCIEAALSAFDSALSWDPFNPAIRSLNLLAFNYVAELSEAEITQIHASYERLLRVVAGPKRSACIGMKRDVFRIGLISEDFRSHSVAMFVESVLRDVPDEQFHIYCYSTSSTFDKTSKRLMSYNVQWRDVARTTPNALIATIRADSLDVLIEMGGHTGGARLEVLREPVATMHLGYLGYPAPWGTPRLDARISDSLCEAFETDNSDASSADEHVRQSTGERRLLIEPPFVCYRPGSEQDFPLSLPQNKRSLEGPFVFACFSNLAKIGAEVLQTWGVILNACPQAVLWFRGRGFEDISAKQRITESLLDAGGEAEQVRFLDFVSAREKRLEVYADVDLILDCFPYNGTTTTCEALACGVPVLTVKGNRHVARVGESLLNAVGLSDDFVATDAADYARRAVGFTDNREQLDRVKSQLRRVRDWTRLFDSENFASRFRSALRKHIIEHQAASPEISELLVIGEHARHTANCIEALKLMAPWLTVTHQPLGGACVVTSNQRRILICRPDIYPSLSAKTADVMQNIADDPNTWVLRAVDDPKLARSQVHGLTIWLGIDSAQACADDLVRRLTVWSSESETCLRTGSGHEHFFVVPHSSKAQLSTAASSLPSLPFRLKHGVWISISPSLTDTLTRRLLIFGDVNSGARRQLLCALSGHGRLVDFDAGLGMRSLPIAACLDEHSTLSMYEPKKELAALALRSSLQTRGAQVQVHWQGADEFEWFKANESGRADIIWLDNAEVVRRALDSGVGDSVAIFAVSSLTQAQVKHLMARGLVSARYAPLADSYVYDCSQLAHGEILVLSEQAAASWRERGLLAEAPELQTFASLPRTRSAFSDWLVEHWKHLALGTRVNAANAPPKAWDILSDDIDPRVSDFLSEVAPAWGQIYGRYNAALVAACTLLTVAFESDRVFVDEESLEVLRLAGSHASGPLASTITCALHVFSAIATHGHSASAQAWPLDVRLEIEGLEAPGLGVRIEALKEREVEEDD